MRQKKQIAAIVLVFVLTVTMGGCKSEGAVWPSDVTFQMTLQPFTAQEKETIQSVLAPDGEGLVFYDMGNGPDTGFSYNNTALSNAQQQEEVVSKEEALAKAETVLRPLNLLPNAGEYFVEFRGNPAGYWAVDFYYAFHNLPIYTRPTPEITVGVCKDGVASIRYRGRYSMETVKQTSRYISKREAIKSCQEALKDHGDAPTIAAKDMELTRIYVYAAGKVVPVYMFGGVNAIYVDAISGEATDYPWEPTPLPQP